MDIKEGYIVSSNSFKLTFLKEQSQVKGFKNYKFISINTLLDSVLGKVSNEGILYLLNKYNKLNIYALKEYIKYIPYVDLIKYHNEKLDYLVSLKKELIDNNYYIYDNLFINMINNSYITFVNIRHTKELDLILSKLNTKYEFIFNKSDIHEIDYLEFDTIEQEVDYVAKSINELINSNNKITFNDIKICNANSDYTFLFNRFIHSSNLPIVLNQESNYLTKSSSKLFLSYLDKYDNFNTLFEDLKDKVSSEDYLLFLNIVNSYKGIKYKPIELESIIKYELENTSFKKINYIDKIELINPSNLSDYKDKYIYFINFDINIPKVVKDNLYLEDIEKDILRLDLSIDITKHNKEDLMNSIYECNNLTITFSKTHSFNTSIRSSLVNEYNFNVSNNVKNQIKVDYITDSINIARDLDNLNKYGEKSDNLNQAFDVKYDSYDSNFTQLSKESIDLMKSKMRKLSYTSMDDFYSCKFKYYLSYVLKLNEFEDTLKISLGNIAHKIFEDSYKDNFDYDTSLNEAIIEMLNKPTRVNKELTNKEKYYIDRLNIAVKDAIKQHKEHEKLFKLNKVLTENNFNIELNDYLSFTGKVDKIYYSELEKKFIVVDYKTGNKAASLNNLSDGSNQQLPSYLYLISEGNNTNKEVDLKGYKPIGMYLEHIGINKQNKLDEIKLKGFTSENGYDQDLIDLSFTNLRITQSGAIHGADLNKVLSVSEFDKCVNILKDNINEFIKCYNEAQFDIKYKVLSNVEACSFCNYKDICFKTTLNKNSLEVKPFKEKKLDCNKEGE